VLMFDVKDNGQAHQAPCTKVFRNQVYLCGCRGQFMLLLHNIFHFNPKSTYFGETYISPLFRSTKNVLQLLRHYYVNCSWFCRTVPSLLQSWQSRCCPVSSFSGALQKHKSLVLESCSEFGFNKQAKMTVKCYLWADESFAVHSLIRPNCLPQIWMGGT